jgi:hypothetical protein
MPAMPLAADAVNLLPHLLTVLTADRPLQVA